MTRSEILLVINHLIDDNENVEHVEISKWGNEVAVNLKTDKRNKAYAVNVNLLSVEKE